MIFVQISSLIKAIPKIIVPKATNWRAFLLGFSFLIICLACCSCGSTKVVPIETIRDHQVHDTLYINNVQYDSIYVSQDLFTDRSKDTILIRQHDVEYRYKLLRDTIERIKIEVVHDSIPYEVRIETIKEVPRPKSWLDHLCRYAFFLMLGAILLLLYKFIRNSL